MAGVLNSIFDGLIAPFGGSAAWAMFVLSVLVGIAMLLLFKVSTRQEALATAKRKIMGHIYEMGLFQENLRILMKIQRDLALANLRYLSISFPALIVILIPLIPILVQLESRFAWRPLRVDEQTLVTVKVAEGSEQLLDSIQLTGPEAVAVETLPVRDYDRRTAVWRIRVLQSGRHELTVSAAGQSGWNKTVEAGTGLPRMAAERKRGGWLVAIGTPGEKPLAPDCPLESIGLDLPERVIRYAGVAIPAFWILPRWLMAFCIFSLLFGFALKDVFRVKM